MGAGSGSHALLNNGYPFRALDGSIVMQSYFANRGQVPGFDKLDYHGNVNVTASGSGLSYTANVEFLRAWFRANTPRTITFNNAFRLTWTAPLRSTEANFCENVSQGLEVDAFLTVSKNDGPPNTSLGANERIVGTIYGLFGTDNKFDLNPSFMWVLDRVPPPDAPPLDLPEITIELSYAGLSLTSDEVNQLGVIQWIPTDAQRLAGTWCKMQEPPGSRDTPDWIKVRTLDLNTWYALGIGFSLCGS